MFTRMIIIKNEGIPDTQIEMQTHSEEDQFVANNI